MLRIGSGIDFHQLVEGREFWLGGVKINHHKGALGHSDADVLLHAICDALLGTLALGDIGTHFPDTDMQWKDVDSKKLLEVCRDKVAMHGYKICNVDSTVLLQEPKIKPYIDQMQLVISSILHITLDAVSIKATTTEHMGFTGRGEGIVAQATVLVQKQIED